MVQHTQVATAADEQYRQAVDRELTNLEERERQLMAEERRERAAKLGLVLRGIPDRSNRPKPPAIRTLT